MFTLAYILAILVFRLVVLVENTTTKDKIVWRSKRVVVFTVNIGSIRFYKECLIIQ